MTALTLQQVIDQLVELDVAKWGQHERTVSRRINERNYPTLGLALNRLAHYDPDKINTALANEAKLVMTDADWHVLRQGD